jgi:hypothetical protein
MEPNVSDELASSVFKVEEMFFFCLLLDDIVLPQTNSIDVSNFVSLCLCVHVCVCVCVCVCVRHCIAAVTGRLGRGTVTNINK